MKAVVAREFGKPETFVVEELPDPPLGPGDVRVAIGASGVSFVDALIAEGKYQVRPPLPYIPGTEFAGIVTAVGAEVRAVAPGDRICATGFGGALADTAVVPAKSVLRIPATMTLSEASVFKVSYATAYHALVQRGGLKPDETVLVLGAAGAVGYAAIQIARALGARVVASASTESKRAFALRAGADTAIPSVPEEWRSVIERATGNKGVDIVVDPVGGGLTEPAFRLLGWKGRHLVIGFAAGQIPSLRANLALLKGAALVGVDIRRFEILEPDLAAANDEAVFGLYEQGVLRPAIAKRFTLTEFAAAFAAVARADALGRIVVTPDPAGKDFTG